MASANACMIGEAATSLIFDSSIKSTTVIWPGGELMICCFSFFGCNFIIPSTVVFTSDTLWVGRCSSAWRLESRNSLQNRKREKNRNEILKKKQLKINEKLNFTKTFQLPKSAHRANKNILKASKDGNRIIL